MVWALVVCFGPKRGSGKLLNGSVLTFLCESGHFGHVPSHGLPQADCLEGCDPHFLA